MHQMMWNNNLLSCVISQSLSLAMCKMESALVYSGYNTKRDGDLDYDCFLLSTYYLVFKPQTNHFVPILIFFQHGKIHKSGSKIILYHELNSVLYISD